jgi:hypothetical protein
MLDFLPFELLYIIAEYLGVIDLYRLTKTCHTLNDLCNCNAIWESKVKIKTIYTTDIVSNYIHNHIFSDYLLFLVSIINENGVQKPTKIMLMEPRSVALLGVLEEFSQGNTFYIYSRKFYTNSLNYNLYGKKHDEIHLLHSNSIAMDLFKHGYTSILVVHENNPLPKSADNYDLCDFSGFLNEISNEL